MNEHDDHPPAAESAAATAPDRDAGPPSRPGVITGLAELPGDADIHIEALAEIYRRTVRSIERAVERGELPPPIRLFGRRTWRVGIIRDYLAARHEKALKTVQRREAARAKADAY